MNPFRRHPWLWGTGALMVLLANLWLWRPNEDFASEAGGYWFRSTAITDLERDFWVKVHDGPGPTGEVGFELQRTAGSPQAGYGFLVSNPGLDVTIRVLIDQQGRYQVSRAEKDGEGPLGDWVSVSTLRAGAGRWNRVAVAPEGAGASLWINEQKVASLDLPGGPGGPIALYASVGSLGQEWPGLIGNEVRYRTLSPTSGWESRPESPRPWAQTACQILLAPLLMFLAGLGLERNRSRSRAPEPGVMAGTAGYTVIGLVCVFFFGGLAVVSNVFPNPTATIWTTLAFVAFALVGVAILVDGLVARHTVDAEGMVHRQPWGSATRFRWSEVKQVRFRSVQQAFEITLDSGRKLSVGVWRTSVPEFSELVLRQVPDAALSPDTKVLLTRSTEGKLPSL